MGGRRLPSPGQEGGLGGAYVRHRWRREIFLGGSSTYDQRITGPAIEVPRGVLVVAVRKVVPGVIAAHRVWIGIIITRRPGVREAGSFMVAVIVGAVGLAGERLIVRGRQPALRWLLFIQRLGPIPRPPATWRICGSSGAEEPQGQQWK